MKELEETLKAHKPNLDTTGLENSFDQFGHTIFEENKPKVRRTVLQSK